MKTCIFITGTNAVGKSTVAKILINRYGGIRCVNKQVTYCNDNTLSLAGDYLNSRYGGVDRVKNSKGSSCTSELPTVVEEALRHSEVCVCEGSFMNTFGLNLSNALFKAEHQIVISLFAPPMVIYNRIKKRSCGKNKDGVRDWDKIMKKQVQALRAAQKWHSIGVKVIQVDTSKTTPESIADIIQQEITNYT